MGKHDASDYEGKHTKDRDWSYTWQTETNDGGSSTGCLIGMFLMPISLLRRLK